MGNICDKIARSNSIEPRTDNIEIAGSLNNKSKGMSLKFLLDDTSFNDTLHQEASKVLLNKSINSKVNFRN